MPLFQLCQCPVGILPSFFSHISQVDPFASEIKLISLIEVGLHRQCIHLLFYNLDLFQGVYKNRIFLPPVVLYTLRSRNQSEVKLLLSRSGQGNGQQQCYDEAFHFKQSK